MRAVNAANKKKKKNEQSSDEDDEENPSSKADGVYWNKQTMQFEVKQMQAEDAKPNLNPNFGRYLCFDRIKLKRDMMLWPNLVIQLYEDGFEDTAQPLHVVLPTFLFADFMKEPKEE
jgi:hypothetical protein